MKKSFKLLSALFIALAGFATMQAGEITLFEGTNANEKVPIRGQYVDTENYTIQTIMPEDQLTELVGKEINSIKFYVANEGGSQLEGGLLAVSVGTTTTTSFPSWSPSPLEGLTHVADITFTKGETEILINFEAPFTYEGGNFVIETKVVTTTVWEDVAFYGLNSGYNNALVKGNYTASVEQFFPKTTFGFVGGDTPEPEFIRGDVNGDKDVTIGDVTALVNMLLRNDPMIPAADTNLDEKMTISDVTALINYLLSKSWPTQE